MPVGGESGEEAEQRQWELSPGRRQNSTGGRGVQRGGRTAPVGGESREEAEQHCAELLAQVHKLMGAVLTPLTEPETHTSPTPTDFPDLTPRHTTPTDLHKD